MLQDARESSVRFKDYTRLDYTIYTILYYTVPYCTIPYHTVLYCSMPYFTLVYRILFFSPAPYSAISRGVIPDEAVQLLALCACVDAHVALGDDRSLADSSGLF